MPRKPNREVCSAEVQGEGSSVTFRRLLWGEYQALSRRLEAKEITQEQHSGELVARQVAGWNWTDGEGKPLPAPVDDPTVMERLTDEEMAWLVGQLNAEATREAEASKSG